MLVLHGVYPHELGRGVAVGAEVGVGVFVGFTGVGVAVWVGIGTLVGVGVGGCFRARRRSVVFLVSDFLSDGWERALKVTAQRHDLVPVVVRAPAEELMPEVGLVAFEDLETGEVEEFDTSGWNVLAYRRQLELEAAARDAALRRLNVETVEVRTDRPYVDALVAFFKARARRLAHG